MQLTYILMPLLINHFPLPKLWQQNLFLHTSDIFEVFLIVAPSFKTTVVEMAILRVIQFTVRLNGQPEINSCSHEYHFNIKPPTNNY
jgi:hypothetical protein